MTIQEKITPDMIRAIHTQRVAVRQVIIEEQAKRKAEEEARLRAEEEARLKVLIKQIDEVYEQQASLLAQSILDKLYMTIINEKPAEYRFVSGKVTIHFDESDLEIPIIAIKRTDNSSYLRHIVAGSWVMRDYYNRGGCSLVGNCPSDQHPPSYNITKHVLFEKVKEALQRKGLEAVVPRLRLPRNRTLNMVIGNQITVDIN